MGKVERFKDFDDMLERIPKNDIIANAYIKTWNILNRKGYENIMCSVSGGRDSDVMLDMCYRCDVSNKVHYVFIDTGIEYEATKGHLTDIEAFYGIVIERIRAVVPVPLAVKRYGIPFLSKDISGKIYYLQKNNFTFDDKTYEEHMKENNYPKYAIEWFDNRNYSNFNIGMMKFLREYMIDNKPSFTISKKCCDYSKKKTFKKYEKENNIQLRITGIRKAEGGQRGTTYHACFYEGMAGSGISLFMPIFWFVKDTMNVYENYFKIENSLCYTVYGFRRTGCAGCPYGGKEAFKELEIIKEHEPKLYKAVWNIFGKSYEYTKGYYAYRENKKIEEKRKEIEKQNNF